VSRQLSAALTIAARIVRQRIRDRSAIIFAVVTPLGLAMAFSVLIPNQFDSFHTTFVVADQDHGALATTLVDQVLGQLQTSGVADIRAVDTVAEATAAVRAGSAGAGIVIPAGFTDAVTSGRPAEVRVVSGEYAVSVEIARSTVDAFASDVGATQLLIATSVATGVSDATTSAAAQAVAREPGPIAVSEGTTANLQADLATFYGAAMAIMFVFFATQYGALAILADRDEGTLNRLLAAPITPAAIVVGSSLAGFVLGLVSMTILVVATTVLVHAAWGPPALVGLLIVAAVMAAMGISTLAATLARTTRQAGSLNAIVAISMSAVGGVFIPLSQAPVALATISQVTPHAWFLRGVNTLAGPNPGLADIAQPVLVLLLTGAVTGGLGLARARRSLVA
jgi:ABC-2 type transport system permease protein